MNELLPCPFCGGEAVFHNSLRPPETYPCRVYCDNCWAEVGGYSTEAEAIAAWNSRAAHSTLTAEQVRKAAKSNSRKYKSPVDDGIWMKEYDWQAIADELNSRAERTCEFISSKGSDYPPVCSACGYELGIYDCEWFEDGTYGYGGNYCPNCGCKVVGE